MANIRELSLAEALYVSGGGANTATENVGVNRSSNKSRARNSLGRNAPTHIYSDPGTVKCANGVFGGLISGIPKGPGGMAFGVAGGALKGDCLGSSNNNSSRNSSGCNSSSSNCAGGSAASTCNR